MRGHARLSPSGAHRWLACTPSAVFESHFPDSRSEAAEEGTFAHEWSEVQLRHFILGKNIDSKVIELKKSKWFSQSLMDYTEEYISYVTNAYMEGDSAVLLLEQRLDCSKWVPGGFGYGDAVVISDNHLEVIDLKYGRSVHVPAKDNPQLRLYGLGAYQELSCVYDFKDITVTIVQPRNGGVSSETLSVEELLEWGERIKPLAQMAAKGEGDFRPGEHCFFCKAKCRCKALADYELEIAKKQFDDISLLSDEDVSNILSRADGLVSWANAVKDYALKEAINVGKVWPGWKLVEGRSNRKLSDTDKAAEVLLNEGFTKEEIYKPQDLLGFSAMEKLVGKKKLNSLWAGLIIKPPGAPKLAPESDDRPEWNSAKTDFEEIPD